MRGKRCCGAPLDLAVAAHGERDRRRVDDDDHTQRRPRIIDQRCAEQYHEQQRQKKIDAKAEREAKKLAKNPRSAFRKGREISQRSGGLGSPLFGRTRKPVEPLHAKVVSDVKPLRPIALATSKHFIP